MIRAITTITVYCFFHYVQIYDIQNAVSAERERQRERESPVVWLHVPERITYKVAVLTYRALTGDVPQYLWQCVRIADVPSRHRRRSSTSDDLIVPAVRLTSIVSRAFPVAGARIWNTLPLHVTSLCLIVDCIYTAP